MTVSYQYEVASSTSGGFIRLLVRWRGSVWKLVYREIFIFIICYCSLTSIYHYVLTDPYKRIFETIVFFCSAFMDIIPLSFVLGFYVSFTASRWWNQYRAIPWPDKLMNSISLYVRGASEERRVVRRTLMRYLNVTLVLVLRSISMAVKRRFPTKEHLVEAGFLTKVELELLQSVPSTEFNTFWIPCTWFVNLLKEHADRIDSCGLKLIMEEFNSYRSKCGLLWSYDWISVPLVYTQVVTLATYAFYLASIFGRQRVDKPMGPSHKYEYFVPGFTVLQLFFYMGLLKVAEQLVNPFGDDDEDFELNWIIDRHVKVSYLGVDSLRGLPPPLVKDFYFDTSDMKLPYTEASLGYRKKTYRGSVARMIVPEDKRAMVLPNVMEDSEDESEVAAQYGLASRQASLWTLVGGTLNAKCASLGSRLHLSVTPRMGEGKSGRAPSQGSSMREFLQDLTAKVLPPHWTSVTDGARTPESMVNRFSQRRGTAVGGSMDSSCSSGIPEILTTVHAVESDVTKVGRSVSCPDSDGSVVIDIEALERHSSRQSL